MATPSPEPQQSWQRLTASARDAAAPADVDVRIAVRAQISAVMPMEVKAGIFDDVLALFSQRWLQAGVAVLAAGTFWACRIGFDVIHELAVLSQLQGPIINGI
jgi:hypothetical protein